jgi:hypothetical protein
MQNGKVTFESYEADPEISRRQWRKDKVHQLPEGISLVPDGRAASLYIRRGNRMMAIPAELAGTSDFDVVLFVPSKGLRWIDVTSFSESPAAAEESEEELNQLRQWLSANGIRASF